VSQEDITDPRVVPRWVEAGVSGVARAAEWDVSLVVELPDLAGTAEAEIHFAVLESGEVVPGDEVEPGPVLSRLAEQLREHLPPPFEATALRQGASEWFLGAKRANLLAVDLPDGLAAREITVAVGPEGERTLLVDGKEPDDLDPPTLEAAEAIEALARPRHGSFVARAVRGGGAWKLTIDPL
jgi:hypothetical protein